MTHPAITRGTLVLALALGWAGALAAQDTAALRPEQIRPLIAEREANITRAEARRLGLEARADSLRLAKEAATPGSAQHEALSNRILEVAAEIRPVQRDLGRYYTELNALNTQLYGALNRTIADLTTRYNQLRAAGRTTQGTPEMRSLVERLRRLLAERERVAAAIEDMQEDLNLPSLTFDPTDTPRDLRSKEAIARDAVDRIGAAVDRVEGLIEDQRRKIRMQREVDRLQRDIALWGDEGAARSGDEIAQILENRGQSQDRPGGGNPFEPSPQERIQALEARRLQLIGRRADFAALADQFAERLREFYRN